MKNILSLIALISLFVGCTKDPINSGNDPSQKRVRLLINTGTGEFSTPQSRALANESGLDRNLWVLVFDGSDYNATFVEAAQAQEGTGTEIGKYFISLTQSSNPRMLVVVANASEFVQAKKATLTGQTLTGAMNLLLYGDPSSSPTAGSTPLSSPVHTTVPFVEPSPLAMPMSATLPMPSGINSGSAISSDGTNSGSALLLSRITAKVVIDGTGVFDRFTILGVSADKTPRSGGLVGGLAGAIVSNAGNLTRFQKDTNTPLVAISTPADAASNNTLSSPLYLFESAVGEATAIIIKGSYQGTIGYYRLQFISSLGAPINVKRNCQYTFTILSVAQAGYPTLAQAMDATVSSNNIAAQITVTDPTGHEIIDNGIYYLSVSNSEVIMYDGNPALQSFSDIVTITTNATAAMLGGTNTSTISAPRIVGPGNFTTSNTGVNRKITLSTGSGNVGTTTINLADLDSDFADANGSVAEIKLVLGNLVKTIKITRHPYLNVSGIEKLAGDDFTSGTVVAQGTGNFLSLSATGDDDTASTSVIVPGSGGPLYLTAPLYVSTVVRGGGIVFAMRNNNKGRVKLFVGQRSIEPIKVQVPATTGRWPYVGAFWRAAQRGERLIQMPNTTSSEWRAEVIDGADWIELASYYGSIPSDDYPTGDTPQVSGGSFRVFGSGDNIQFRIGLKSTLSANFYDVTTPPRYGLVVVSYEGESKLHPIFIRQGDAPDYLMEPRDADNNDNSRGTHLLSKKLSAYNITDYNQFGGSTDITSNTQFPVAGGAIAENRLFTKYPSQAGYMMQWAIPNSNTQQQMRVYNPTSPLSFPAVGTINGNYWFNGTAGFTTEFGLWGGTNVADNLRNTNEACPRGYRRPQDGSTGVASDSALPNGVPFSESEIMQSLQYNSAATTLENSLWGYYADGFFDRYDLLPSLNAGALPNVRVSTGATVAYVGSVVFNPFDHHSIFFAAAGTRAGSNGALNSSGAGGYYWTAGRDNSIRGSRMTFLPAQSDLTTPININYATPIRCVKE